MIAQATGGVKIEENRTALQHALESLASVTEKLDRGDGTIAIPTPPSGG